MTRTFPDIAIPEELIRRFDIAGPRYTSYPTADRFAPTFGADDLAHHLAQRADDGGRPPLSLYVHLPFCASLCYYCACNRIITKEHRRSAKYLRYLEQELAILAGQGIAGERAVQLHFGGGTPTFLHADELRELMRMLRQQIVIAPEAEISIEIDPRTVEEGTMPLLAELGFNRASLGVQDFDPAVQQAVHRVQSLQMVERVLQSSREAGFSSINFDLIYGLPKQSVASFSRTLDEVIRLSPERIALYNYAHLPTRFLAQRRIAEHDLPSAEERLQIFLLSLTRLLDAGYVYIGLDHFAKPDDELATALAAGTLHRNFQGYTTRAGCDLLGLGVSAISQIGASYSQSVKTLDEYCARLDAGTLPVERGIVLTAEDQLRRRVIIGIMCGAPVDLGALCGETGLDASRHFAPELAQLQPLVELGLVALDRLRLTVLPKGRLFVRAVAMVFDVWLREATAARFSRLI
ncbi:MAG: oxygen-independent coproporphyrinogen oxidase [Burkholderiaceae bacterium]|nr:oxygen-independent coproporphyrinogen oxidase [Burkholderiaceae bacterium]